MDQLDMLLCTLPSEETFRWGRWGGEKLPEDIPFMFYDFCQNRAADLRSQVQSQEGEENEVRIMAWPSGYPRWLGPCILGDICGSYHMPEVCRMFEHMSPEGRLSVIQKKRLCQFCLWHPDTEQCPVIFSAGLPHQRMYEDASQDAAQGSLARGGQTCRARDGTACRRPPP